MIPNTNPRVDNLPEFKDLGNVHIFMSANYKGRSYLMDPADEYGFKFIWVMDSNGEKVGEFPVCFMREETKPVKTAIMKYNTNYKNIYTELAELQYGYSVIGSAIGYLLAVYPTGGTPEDFAYFFLLDKQDELLTEQRRLKALIEETGPVRD